MNDRNPNDNGATAPVTGQQSHAKLKITKKANRRTARVRSRVKYTIRVKNVSKTTAVNVEVCDLVPRRLSVVKRARGKLKRGNLCWTIQTLAPGKTKTFRPTLRIANGRGSRVTNTARARAVNARSVRAKARVHVPQVAARRGGVTG